MVGKTQHYDSIQKTPFNFYRTLQNLRINHLSIFDKMW
ncbi:hypothetical protein LEP1GSC021_1902 [Leptospira noguchii str. 1993005606]|uniref:Uncharacterized protein n=2 Tax=Leptospira noguchii TaxID=28182 RepID=M6Y727_9LEPT|nr:hypothetical protein LEP1GSC035_0570 [Leptospira noguchii str. 2007001578]EMO90162.1 hypothetical protein LEP1GSC024_4143 [Leptospira noguchii str. 2001034031]EPE86462.1 hypothetical protein LEP1GSC021_1902 [Leptospira noguchii str. 1993005606]